MQWLEPWRFRSGWWGGAVGAIVAVALGGWLYVQQRDIGKRRALDGRETALIAGFEEHVIAPRPAGATLADTGPLVALRGTGAPGTVVSLPADPAAGEPALQSAAVTPPALESAMLPPQELPPARDPAAPEPASQAAAVTAPALESAMSPPQELPPLRDPAAAEPASQSAAVTPPATLGSATSPPNEQPTAPSQEPPGSVTPLPPRRPLQIRIATTPRAVPPPALLRRREAP
jgi:hypothetical protein